MGKADFLMKQWTIRTAGEGRMLSPHFHPAIADLLVRRGITTTEQAEVFLRPDYDRDMHDPFLFADMEKVVARLTDARADGELVGIFGDHDVDGVSGATILKEAFDDLGIRNTVYIPDKHTEGHGINRTAIESFAKEGATVFVSVDCGITNIAEVAEANQHGMDVIIIDHHHVPEELPPAFAIINPKMSSSGYPFPDLCGTGTAFKVITALFQRIVPEKTDQLKWLLDIVSVGTIADCMPLYGENRTIVKYGLYVLSKTRRIGFQELCAVGRIPVAEGMVPDVRTVAFHIAPRINAAGRMAHARDAHHLLIERDRVRARTMALDLEDKNKRRQKITEEILREVREIARTEQNDQSSIFAAAEHFHIGIVGIIAGRIANEFQKPAGVFWRDTAESRGSFRSVPHINIVHVLEQCKDLLIRFGGHHQAAGATVATKNLDAFAHRFHEIVGAEMAKGDVPTDDLMIDAELSPETVNFTFVEQLKQFEPFGEGNREPLFSMNHMTIDEMRLVGNGEKHVKMRLRAKGKPMVFDAIGFGLGERAATFARGAIVDVAFHVQENIWNATRSLQLKIVDLRPHKL